jgi:hypothetical protein
MIKKILISTFLAFVVYKASAYYFSYTSSTKLASCPTASNATQAKERAIKTREDLLASTKAWRCLKQKQNFAEAHFFKIHEGWLNPSIEYVNPPFTEAELNPKVTLTDEALKRDLIAFKAIYSQEFMKQYLANMRLAHSGSPEKGYQRVNDSLQVLIAKLRDFKPESTKFGTLKTQLAYSLNQVKQNNTDAISLNNKANLIIASSDTLLAKPKEEIRQRKNELLRNQSELDSLVFQLQSNVSKQEELGNELIKTSDEIDVLYKMYL